LDKRYLRCKNWENCIIVYEEREPDASTNWEILDRMKGKKNIRKIMILYSKELELKRKQEF
jgi:hypothetical protein